MKKYRSFIILILLIISITLASCSNMHMGTSMGVSMNFGSNGPTIQPHMNIGMSSGGYYY